MNTKNSAQMKPQQFNKRVKFKFWKWLSMIIVGVVAYGIGMLQGHLKYQKDHGVNEDVEVINPAANPVITTPSFSAPSHSPSNTAAPKSPTKSH